MSTITLGLDLGDRSSRYAVLDAEAHLIGEGSVATTREAMADFFAALPLARVILEVGTHSPWVSRVIAGCEHEVIVANPRRVRLISAAVRKNDRIDAVTLARLGRADPALLSPIRHRGETTQADLGQLRARDALVRTRTLLINHVQGTVKAMGYRVPSSTSRTFALRARTALPSVLAPALASVVETIAHLTDQIAAADRAIALRRRGAKARDPAAPLLGDRRRLSAAAPGRVATSEYPPAPPARHELNRPVRGLRLLLPIFEIARQMAAPHRWTSACTSSADGSRSVSTRWAATSAS